MMRNQIREITIGLQASMLDAMKKMDSTGRKLLIVNDFNDKYSNLISIGDIQRALIKGVELSEKIENLQIDKKVCFVQGQSLSKLREDMLRLRCEFMPEIDVEGNLVNVHFWDDFIGNEKPISAQQIDLPVVIMAGGKGTRLKPISNVIPKPLIPIGETTIVEEIIRRFQTSGCQEFFLSVNYKKEIIEYYLSNSGNVEANLNYFVEDKPLGTAGSLSLLKDKIDRTFFVSNCDILIDQDLSELYEYHRSNKNEITMVAALKHYKLSYGSIISGKDGLLEAIDEKPELTFKINAGVYILEPHLLNDIPADTFFHITDLIAKVKDRGGRIGVFPVSEKSWVDIGEWPEYVKTVRKLSGEHDFLGL
jgi:dTDP-glucose pyrophosphorylase